MILRYMPLQDAVKTSALSRQWRKNWRNMSEIVVDVSFHEYLQKKYPSQHQHDFVRIVYDVLLNKKVPILNFQLYITVQGCPSEEVVGSWIVSLSESGVIKLDLANDYEPVFYKLPSEFYSYGKLISLYLCGFHFTPPSTFQGFPNLKHLEFRCNIFQEDHFQRFITSCPLLEQITLSCTDGTPKDIVIICSESLKFLSVDGELKSIFINAQGLETLDILPASPMVLNSLLRKVNSTTLNALGNLQRMKTLWFGGHALKFLAAGGFPHKYPMDSLTNIKFHLLDFEDHDQISVAVLIIQNAPYLRYLEIKAYWRESYAVKLVPEVSLGDGIALGCLKTVEFYELRGIKPELDLVRSLLACCPSLEKMTIKAKPVAGTDGVDTIPTELMFFSRVSPKAHIHYSKST